MCAEAETCIRSDSVKNRSSAFLSTVMFPLFRAFVNRPLAPH
jgi:hypothetical protein